MLATLSLWLRDQGGNALPMALGFMFVITIGVVAALEFSGSSERSANRSAGHDRALALAEAGMEQATSMLTTATDVINPAAVVPGSEQVSEGTLGWSGSLAGLTWTLTGTGTVSSQISGGAPISRTVSRQIAVSTLGSPWHYLFADGQPDCMNVNSNATISAPLYVRGDLCIANDAHLTGSPVEATGTVTVGSNGSIGYSGTPIARASLAGGCTGGAPDPHPCASSDRVYATTLTQTVTPLSKPPIDLPRWYQDAKPGPSHNCTSGSVPGGFDNDSSLNSSRTDFDLTSGAAYDCQYWEGSTLIGRLAWSPATNTLMAAGTIFLDGTIALSGDVVYEGRATIYSSNVITTSNNARLCGSSGCTAAWNPLENLLALVAGGSTAATGLQLNDNVTVQIAAYVVNDYHAVNNATNWGPVIARGIQIDNNADNSISLGALPPGAPGMDTTLHPVTDSWRG